MNAKLLKLFFFIPLFVLTSRAQTDTLLTLTEIMFRPLAANSEYIEIFNLSNDQSIDLAGIKIKYQTSSPDSVISPTGNTVLQPRHYAIILEGDYDLDAGIYKDIIPANALVLTIDNNAFGSSGMSNGSDRNIYLLSAEEDALESYLYSANNSEGLSDEKISLEKNNYPDNWSNSIIVNGTPGFKNSIAQKDFDLTAESLTIQPFAPAAGENIEFNLLIKNIGLESALTFSVKFSNDINSDSISQPNEIFSNQNYNNLSGGDSLNVIANLSTDVPGEMQIIAEVDYQSDEDTSNNKLISVITIDPKSYQFNDIVINEIMYAPQSGEPEWIEIFNRTDESIDLIDWRLKDNSSSVRLTSESLVLNPYDFVVLADDSTITDFYEIPMAVIVFNLPSLNNGGDDIVLLDALSNRIDSVSYVPDWGGGNGMSLERIGVDDESNDPSNWSTVVSPLNATPGLINSVTPKNIDLALTSFSPLNDYGIIGEVSIFTAKIKNAGTNNVQSYQLKIYHDVNQDSSAQENELIETKTIGFISSGDSIEAELNITGFAEGVNYYIAVSFIENDEFIINNTGFAKLTGVVINEVREDIVINEIQYAPPADEPEWIELYNRSSKVIDLSGYQIADNSDTARVVSNYLQLLPEEYFVIAKDSAIITKYDLTGKHIISNFPTLNNSSDKLMILDSLDRVIDSLEYFSDWGKTGKSLERIDPFDQSASQFNWKASEDLLGATPGKINSVTQKEYDVGITNIAFDPEHPLIGNNASVFAGIKNYGKETALFNLILFEDTDKDSIPDIQLSTISSLSVSSGDSNKYQFSYTIQNLTSARSFMVSAELPNDGDTTNNAAYNTISPGYSTSSILISEIMYLPQNGEPEWIEVYNPTEDTVNLSGWKIADVITSPDTQIFIDDNYYIEPDEYLVIARDSSIFEFHRSIPSKIIFSPFPNLNNDEDGVVLLDNADNLIDNVIYNSNWAVSVGYSLERISFSGYSTDPANWSYSQDIEQSTPGRINSIAAKDFDLTLDDLFTYPKNPLPGDPVYIDCKVMNNGIQTATYFSVSFSHYNGINRQSLGTTAGSNLAGRDSIILRSQNTFIINDSTLISAEILFENDEDTLNNYFETYIVPGYAEGSVKINEIMYDPADEMPEWIEFVNTTNAAVDLLNWEISDLLSSPTKNKLVETSIVIQPDEYFIVASDSSAMIFDTLNNINVLEANFGTLGNSEDGIIIYDFRGAVIDSVKYKSDWGGNDGISLERFSLSAETNDSTNWASSLSDFGSTPGSPNSIIAVQSYSSKDIIINEIMYEPDASNTEFVELFNRSDNFVNLGGWKIDNQKGNSFTIADKFVLLPPGKYFVAAADSSLLFNYPQIKDFEWLSIINRSSFNLSNDLQTLIIKDIKRNVIDSLMYSSDWHNKNISITRNRSLERLNPNIDSNDPSNWSTSVSPEGATPGFQNSIYTGGGISRTADLTIEPNPFSPDNDGFEDFTIINYNLTQAISQIRIKVYDSKGRLVRTLVNNKPSGANGNVIFDGLDDSGRPLRLGIYILFFEALNNDSGVLEIFKKPLVIARKL